MSDLTRLDTVQSEVYRPEFVDLVLKRLIFIFDLAQPLYDLLGKESLVIP